METNSPLEYVSTRVVFSISATTVREIEASDWSSDKQPVKLEKTSKSKTHKHLLCPMQYPVLIAYKTATNRLHRLIPNKEHLKQNQT
jgi:hypothetical protein